MKSEIRQGSAGWRNKANVILSGAERSRRACPELAEGISSVFLGQRSLDRLGMTLKS